MATTLTTVDKALKEFYLPGLREQLNNKVMFLAQIEKSSEQVEGRRAVLSLHVTRNAGHGARAEGDALPSAGNQGYVEERVGLKYNYARVRLNGQVIRAMKSDRGSFVRAVESELGGAVKDLKRDVNRQLFNNANQTIAQCGTTSNSTTVVLATGTGRVALRQLYIGMIIDIGTTADSDSVAADRTVEAVDFANLTVEISGAAVTTDATHFITLANSAGNEITGLREIVAASGTLFNVDPSTTPVWKSQAFDNSGTPRNATDTLFEYVIDEVELESGESPNFIIASHGVVRNYAAQLQADRRYNDTLTLNGGFEAATITVGSTKIPFASDRDAPNGTAFVCNKDDFKFHRSSDWEWMQEDGAVMARVDGYDAYDAVLFLYAELAISNRNQHAIVTDLNETTA